MNDSQWPRWEVFKQDSDRKPYQAVGSVHAVDPEHALLNARNVFVRRPSAVALWVARADDIFSLTREEMEKQPDWAKVDEGETAVSYHIFSKSNHRRSMTFMDHLGELEATSPQAALQKAFDTFDAADDLAWWVIPSRAIVESGRDVAAAWFDPAKTKTYKQQSQYGFVSPTRKGKQG